jgi:hypothetical protein
MSTTTMTTTAGMRTDRAGRSPPGVARRDRRVRCHAEQAVFVAMPVAGRRRPADRPVVVGRVRAAASIVAFTNALTLSLFGLVPGDNAGYPLYRRVDEAAVR